MFMNAEGSEAGNGSTIHKDLYSTLMPLIQHLHLSIHDTFFYSHLNKSNCK
jgi:hypothetical protein